MDLIAELKKRSKRLPKHVVKFVEGELLWYEDNKKLLSLWDRQRDELMNGLKAHTQDQKRHQIGSVYDPVGQLATEIIMLEEPLTRTEFYVKAVDDVWDNLTLEERQIIKLRYFKGLTWQAVSMGLCIS